VSRTCCLCGDRVDRPGLTTCDRCLAAARAILRPAPTAAQQAQEDAKIFGVGFLCNGTRLHPQSVVIVREPKPAPESFAQFWAREGARIRSFADLKDAAYLAWTAARK